MKYGGHVRNFVVDNFLFGEEDGFDDNTSFVESGIIDSMGMLQLIAFLEKTFAVEIADRELLPENLDSCALIDAFICRKLDASITGPMASRHADPVPAGEHAGA